MKTLVTALLFLWVVQFAVADKYVSAAGDNTTGADWTHAYTTYASAQTAAVRGTDTIWVAGNATGYAPFLISKAVSGTNVLTIKAATIANHGTGVGWSNGLAVDDGAGNATNPAYIHNTTCSYDIQVTTSYIVFDGQVGLNSGAKGFSSYSDCALTSTMLGHVRIGSGTGGTYVQVFISNLEVNDQMTEAWYIANSGAANAHNIFYIVNDNVTGLFLSRVHFHNVTRDVFDFVGCDTTIPGSACVGGVSAVMNDIEITSSQFDHNRTSAQHGQGIQANNVNTLISRYNLWWDIEGTSVDGVCLTHRCSDFQQIGNVYVNDSIYNAAPHLGISKIAGDNYSGSDSAHSYTALNGEKFYSNTVININPSALSKVGVINGTATWKAATAYGGASQPYSIIDGGIVWGATTAGVSGGSKPTFTGVSVADGTVTWTQLQNASTDPDTRNNLFIGNSPTLISGSAHDYNLILNGTIPVGVGFVLAAHETNTTSGSSCPFTGGCAAGTLDATLSSDTVALAVGPDTGAFDTSSPFNTTPYNTDPSGVSRTTSRGAYQFVAAGNQTLTVAGLGNGNGKLCSDGAACVDGIINCVSTAGVSSGTCTHTFASGSNVTLTATATSGTFTGWSGVCAGTSTCPLTMTSPFSASATFQSAVSCNLTFASNSINAPSLATPTTVMSGLTGPGSLWFIFGPPPDNAPIYNCPYPYSGCNANGQTGNIVPVGSGLYTGGACSNGVCCTGSTAPLNINTGAGSAAH